MTTKGRKGGKGGKGGSRSSGGAMMGMRSGFRRMVGQDKKGRRKKDVTFWQVLAWVLVVVVVGFVIWGLRG